MGQKVLFATKNRITGDAVQSILSNEGFKVQIPTNNLLNLDQQLKAKNHDIVIFCEMTVQVYYEKLSQSVFNLQPIPKMAFILGNRTSGYLVKGLQKGIDGFVHKENGVTDLLKCLNALKNDCTYISPSLSGKIQVEESFKSEDSTTPKLTCREEEIIMLVRENKTSRQIGEILNLSTKTIQNHRQNMCNKLGLKGRNKLYEYALEHYQ